MIGPRTAGIVGTLLLGLLLAAGLSGDGLLRAVRERYLREVALAAEAALLHLESRLDGAREAARAGAALIVEGDQPPQPHLEAAADQLLDADAAALAAGVAADRLRGTLASVRPGEEDEVPGLPAAADLASIATQLRAAAGAVDGFLVRRHAAEQTLAWLEQALSALDDDDLLGARGALEGASDARQVLVDWERPPVTLDLWLQTTGAMLDAARAIVDAAEAGDRSAAQRAADAYATAAAEAHRADVSLALSLSETGAGLTGTPLQRLAAALVAVTAAHAEASALGG